MDSERTFACKPFDGLAFSGPHQAGLKVHIDGARLWNAAVSLGVSGAALAGAADSVSFCLSKGLSCPVGSLLCGSAEFVAVARERRRLVGGALRQSGVLAACGLVALDTMIERLAEDHAHARRLAIGLAELDCLELDPATVETNIVWFRCDDADWPARCQAAGLRLVSLGGGRCRMVTHAGVGPAEVEQALAIAAQAAKR